MVAYKWIKGSTEDGRLVAMPWDIGPAGFWYRTDLFEAAGYPTEPEKVEELIGGSKHTWDDFLNAKNSRPSPAARPACLPPNRHLWCGVPPAGRRLSAGQ